MVIFKVLPEKSTDEINGVGVIEMTFTKHPVQYFNVGPVEPEVKPVELSGKWISSPMKSWQVSELQDKKCGISETPAVSLSDDFNWKKLLIRKSDGFLDLHFNVGDADGILYIGNKINVPRDGIWRFYLGHDGGCKVFLDGITMLIAANVVNPAIPGRSFVDLELKTGEHELMIAFDTAEGRGWGIFTAFGIPVNQRKIDKKPVFPVVTS